MLLESTMYVGRERLTLKGKVVCEENRKWGGCKALQAMAINSN